MNEFPINQLQQEVTRLLIAVGPHVGKIWFALGSMGAVVLSMLALAPFFLSGEDRTERRSWNRLAVSDGVFLFACCLVIVILRTPGLCLLAMNPDEGCLILGARTLLDDPRYWLSFENQSLGPVSTFVVALPALVGAPVDYTSIKVVAILTWCATAIVLFFGFRTLYPGGMARVFVLPIVLASATFNFWDYVAFNGEHMVVLLTAIAFWIHAGLLRDDVRPLAWRSLLLGLVLALMPFAKIQAGPFAFAWGVLACLLAFRSRPVRIAFHAGGVGVVVVLLCVYLFTSGAAYDFWQSYILNNIIYASVGWNAAHADVGFFANVLRSPGYFLTPPDSRGLFLYVALVALAGAVGAACDARVRRRLLGADGILAAVLLVAVVFCVLKPKNNWTHYLLMMFVPMSLLVAVVLDSLAPVDGTRLSIVFQRSTRRWLAVLAVLLGGFVSAEYAMLRGNHALQYLRKWQEAGRVPDTITAAILRHTRPGEPVAHWGGRFEELCLAGVSLGTREGQNERALYPSEQQDYYLRRWTSDVLERRPRVLVDSCTGEYFDHLGLEHFPREEAQVLAHYRLVEEVEGFRFYHLKDPDAMNGALLDNGS